MFNFIPTKVTAKPYYGGKPARLEWSSNIILSSKNVQKPAQGQCFGIYQTTNPKPSNPKPKNPKILKL